MAVVEIVTESFAQIPAESIKYEEPSKFPAIDIDITFKADVGDVNFPELVSAAKAAAGEVLKEVSVKDIYEAEDSSRLTVRFSFASDERTLTKQELAPMTEAITEAFGKMGIANA